MGCGSTGKRAKRHTGRVGRPGPREGRRLTCGTVRVLGSTWQWHKEGKATRASLCCGLGRHGEKRPQKEIPFFEIIFQICRNENFWKKILRNFKKI
jgi:hypothetical protein